MSEAEIKYVTIDELNALKIDPGSFCEDCGHFAVRHSGPTCRFPTTIFSGRNCQCKGFMWQGSRYAHAEVSSR